MLGDDETIVIHDRGPAEGLKGFARQPLSIRRIEQDQTEAFALFSQNSQSGPHLFHQHFGSIPQPATFNVSAQCNERAGVFLHKNSRDCPATQSFDPQGAGSGEKVQDALTAEAILQDVEDGLLHSVGSRPHTLPPHREELLPF